LAQLQTLTTFVAVVAGDDVGLARGQRDPEDLDQAWLLSMWVAPQIRRRGIGRVLIEAVVDWAEAAGCARLVLDVGDANAAAIACYAALGFMPNGVTSAMPAPRSHVTEHQRARRLR
jgi:GNAT superfamily N-acetyltransferase